MSCFRRKIIVAAYLHTSPLREIRRVPKSVYRANKTSANFETLAKPVVNTCNLILGCETQRYASRFVTRIFLSFCSQTRDRVQNYETAARTLRDMPFSF